MTFPKYPEYKDSGVEWLGEVPAHWSVKPLKYLTNFINGMAFKPNEWSLEGTPIIRIENLNDSESFNFYDGKVDGRYHVTKGDLLFGWSGNKGTSFGPYIWGKEGAFYLNQHIFRLAELSADKKWLYWTLKAVTKTIEDQAHGIIGMVHVTKGKLGGIPVPYIPKNEQQVIAAFLDYETARIDALVEQQQRLIELLKEKRQAVISHAVTKGLDPNVPMKDSGVEWMGEVPVHWEVIKLGLIAEDKCDGPFGSALKSEHYTDHGVRVIRLQNIKSGIFNNSDSAYIDEGYYGSSIAKSDVVSGDVLVAGLGDERNVVGRACVAPAGIEPAMVKADCFRFRLIQDKAFPDFIAEQLSSGAEADAGVMASGSTRSRISLSVMSTRKVGLPPSEEQLDICRHISNIKHTFDLLSKKAQLAIRLLQERRSALISAAVTGKIDVRGWQASQHAEQAEVLLAAEERAAYVYGKEPSDEV
ncbi:restriction endonuclease subunit S [uncultured Halomonas sp.]|uniref:restriction endonuclease subunit S n=1 Tax=uncultured Halomonas sp. TaxID=173971 RepID=UPI00260FD24A|nr:restriction endonuclease subunit S [uncultured Halomonas sp.]